MKLLDLRNSPHKAIVDDNDYERCVIYCWSQLPTRPTARGPNVRGGYVQCRPGKGKARRYIYLHRFVMNDIPPGMIVDHLNGNPLDNRRENLRVTSHAINQINQHILERDSRSGIRGVRWFARKNRIVWLADIMVDKRNISLGTYDTEEEATLARQYAELKYFGELCPLPGREFSEWGGMEC